MASASKKGKITVQNKAKRSHVKCRYKSKLMVAVENLNKQVSSLKTSLEM